MNTMIEVGALVRHPERTEWGIGQVQSIIGPRMTVNFENVGKVVINTDLVSVTLERPDWL